MIKKKRINKVEKYLDNLDKGDKIYISKLIDKDDIKILSRIGFTNELNIGEKILPSSNIGPTSMFNSEGKLIPQKDKPKEKVSRQGYWEWEDWGGNSHSKIVDIPYERYPRKFISPPSIEVKIVENIHLEKIIISDEIKYIDDNVDLIKHTINLFLEIFGECEILDKNLKDIIKANKRVIRLNWEVLPKGKYPWNKLKKVIDPFVKNIKEGKRRVIKDRFKIISSIGLEIIAVGHGGFSGYVIFKIPNKELYVLESIYNNNATYIFEENWIELSQKTKSEILNNNLHKYRFIHNKLWKKELKSIVN